MRYCLFLAFSFLLPSLFCCSAVNETDMEDLDFNDFTHITLEDELTPRAHSSFPERSPEQLVDPALLSFTPLEPSDASGSTSDSKGPSSVEGSSARVPSLGNVSPSGSKSPLQMGVDFIKGFAQDKKTTRGITCLVRFQSWRS